MSILWYSIALEIKYYSNFIRNLYFLFVGLANDYSSASDLRNMKSRAFNLSSNSVGQVERGHSTIGQLVSGE